jgi:hypothetical protein
MRILISIVHPFHPISNLFPLFFHTHRVVKSKAKNGIVYIEKTNHFRSNERNNKMNITLRLNHPQTIQVDFAFLIIFFKKLVARLPRFTGASDDPAALHYIFNKYNGEID